MTNIRYPNIFIMQSKGTDQSPAYKYTKEIGSAASIQHLQQVRI